MPSRPVRCSGFATAGLTVVYGDNGSGKSAMFASLRRYVGRRARTGSILPDVFVEPQGRPHARVRYELGGAVANELDWQPGAAIPAELARECRYSIALAPPCM